MRITATIEDLDEKRWDYLHRAGKTSYEFPEDAIRVCATFVGENEVRHVEMPLGAFIGLLMGMSLIGFSTRVVAALNRPVSETRGSGPGWTSEGISPGSKDSC